MPRDVGTGLYHYPDGTPGNPGQTVFSARYNTFINDLSNTLNQTLPVNMGGTGASDTYNARANIDAEVSGAQVTDYDTQVWENGSFFSNVGAAAAPLSDRPWWGIAYGIDQDNIWLEARNGGTLYGRVKVDGVWQSWVDMGALSDARYVNTAGDTMTGNLTVDGTIVAEGNIVSAVSSATGSFQFGTSGTKFLTYDGSNFTLTGGPLFVNGGVYSAVTATIGTYYFGNSGTKYLTYDGSNYILAGGSFVATGNVTSAVTANTGSYQFGTSGTKFLTYDGTNYTLTGGPLYVNSSVYSIATSTTGTYYFGNSGTTYLAYDGTNFYLNGGGIVCSDIIAVKNRVFIDGKTSADNPSVNFRNESLTERGYVYFDRTADEMVVQFQPTGTRIRLGNTWMASSVDTTYKPSGGAWIAGSDARIKTVQGDYTHGLDEVLALHPVVYSYKGNDVFGKMPSDDPGASIHSSVIGKNFVGLVAQECETVMPEMVTKVPGYIDGVAVDDLRTLDNSALVYALVNCIKTLTARIEALEAAQATP